MWFKSRASRSKYVPHLVILTVVHTSPRLTFLANFRTELSFKFYITLQIVISFRFLYEFSPVSKRFSLLLLSQSNREQIAPPHPLPTQKEVDWVLSLDPQHMYRVTAVVRSLEIPPTDNIRRRTISSGRPLEGRPMVPRMLNNWENPWHWTCKF